MTPKVSEEHSDARKIQILMAAWECFAEKGYDQTTMRDISSVSGLSIGAIYNYFESKDDILTAMVEWGKSQQNTAFGIVSLQKSARAALREYFKMFAGSVVLPSTKKMSQGELSFWAESTRRDQFRDIFNEEHEHTRQQFVTLIERGIKNGEIRDDLDPGAIAGFYMALMLGVQVQATLLTDIDIRSYLEQVEEFVFVNSWQE